MYYEKRTPEFGRGLYASKEIRIGTRIMVCEPLAICLSTLRVYDTCSYCFMGCSQLRECPECRFVRYCSTECMINDKKSHRMECTLRPTVDSALAGRMVARAAVSSDVWKLHKGEQKGDDLFSQLFSHIKCNMFSVLSTGLDPFAPEIGTGIFYPLSLVNHACDPNCEYFFQGRTAVLVAKRTIEKDEQLFVSYCVMDVREKRRNALKHFEVLCKCYMCDDKFDKCCWKCLRCGSKSSEEDNQIICNKCHFVSSELVNQSNCSLEHLNNIEKLSLPNNIHFLNLKINLCLEFYFDRKECFIDDVDWIPSWCPIKKRFFILHSLSLKKNTLKYCKEMIQLFNCFAFDLPPMAENIQPEIAMSIFRNLYDDQHIHS